ncbi:hypothetical protein Jiend_31080 [Micromonospora endophytica]|nr:hypothetical protein Jiend_31080 [Micromonospora endophytica]
MTDERTPVSVIGLGLMGRALAGALLAEGHPTTVWNRTAEKATDLVAQGARPADSVDAALASSPLVIVCVTDYDAVRALLTPVGAALDGRVVVNLTSGDSAVARGTAEWVSGRGGSYLDGAILAGPAEIGGDKAALLYAGPRPVFDRYASTLGSLGPAIHVGDDHGLSSLYDVAVLGLMWGILNGFVQGAALLGAAGVPATAFAPLASRGIGTVTGWLAGYATQIDDGTYPADDSTIDVHLAAMAHVIAEGETLGVNVESTALARTLAERAVADGHGGSSYAAMITQFRKPTAEGEPTSEGRPTADPAPDAAAETAAYDPRALLERSRLGILATIKSDGRPQLSPVQPYYDRAAGVIFVSMTEGRAKTANLRRDPRATLEVTSPDGWAWATAEGTATLTGPGTDPHGPEVEALVDYYRRAAGEHPDWAEYRAVMVADRRVLMTMTVDHVYGERVG